MKPHRMARKLPGLLLVLPLALMLAGPQIALARKADYVPEEVASKPKKADKKKKKKPKKKKDGWFPTLKAGFSFAFSQSQGVVGVPDGISLALGLQLNGGVKLKKGPHEWRNVLNIVHTQTKVPNIEPFIKAADELSLLSLYQYRFQRWKWFGFYGGLRMNTALFPGNLVKDADTTVEVRDHAGGLLGTALVPAHDTFRLLDAGAPLFFKQFVGLLAKPLRKKSVALEIRLGTGAVEVWTQRGYVLSDNGDTADILEITRLRDYVQGGVELQIELRGTVLGKILSYAFLADIMYPYATSVDTDFSKAELFNTEFKFNLAIKLWKWASLNYSVSIMRLPMITPDWQISNNLMLAITANIIK